MIIALSILCIAILIYAVWITSKHKKFKEFHESYLRVIKNEASWHEEGRQDITSKPYSISLKDGVWIVGPGLESPAYLPEGKGESTNIRDLMNHAYREAKK